MNLEYLRSIKLVDVLQAFGSTPDPADRNNWKTPIGRITVTGQKYFCHDCGEGGGGAIDLAAALTKTDFKGAIRWLTNEFGEQADVEKPSSWSSPAKPELATKRLSEIPARVDLHWPRVRRYLSETRCLSESLVDQLHDSGRIYSDRYANAVFLLGSGQGAELRGTGQRKFHGVRGEKMPFTLLTAGPLRVAFVESAIDGISLRTLGFLGEIVSLTGSSALMARALADEYRAAGYSVIAAFDVDVAGELMANNLGVPVERLRPPTGGKDWNDALCAQREQILFP